MPGRHNELERRRSKRFSAFVSFRSVPLIDKVRSMRFVLNVPSKRENESSAVKKRRRLHLELSKLKTLICLAAANSSNVK